ncbi:hypothetical protein M0802_009288 [Mischocyttarus mexicanus]|nr:hypothetical protein M0802_009288 [Mischocyttarus mexicanus]
MAKRIPRRTGANNDDDDDDNDDVGCWSMPQCCVLGTIFLPYPTLPLSLPLPLPVPPSHLYFSLSLTLSIAFASSLPYHHVFSFQRERTGKEGERIESRDEGMT